MLLTTIIIPLNIGRISLVFMREAVRINFFVYIRWLQCKVKNMVESWYYWQWRCADWVFDFNIWFASANIRPNPYFSKFILMYKSDFHWPVHQSLHLNFTIKSLMVNSISSSNICYHKNDRYGIIDMLILVQSKHHLTKSIGINYSLKDSCL